MDNHENLVKEILSDMLGVNTAGFTRETELQGELGMDSAEMVDVVVLLEKRFKRTFHRGVERELKTVGDIYDLLSSSTLPVPLAKAG
ncbi:acyl carrier protein [Polyangium jinanense]|uniref:Carrier domain-containing protein n=1 Tax=Polyangium jinanense TaxID=2829994 RepID=A0A9X3XF89_9BACT|nr:phosphopantetheine-binding protein [Polyangium jinanense]MDC3962402.1 hypothetical protein [Polyangium jinanense]MDC3989294.1 hypothetical protein [Polyangium jinanense]